MRKVICLAFTAGVTCALLASCAQPPAPVQALPAGPTPDEVADYARAQAQYRSALASGNGDVVMRATNTFGLIAREILSRQDPRLFEAQVACETYPVAGPPDRRNMRMAYEPQLVQACRSVDWRYDRATVAIRRDLEAKISAADLATIAQAEAGHR